MPKNLPRPKTMGMIKFKDALIYAFPEIVNAYYMIDEEKEERVIVIWKDHENHQKDFSVCVNADSIPAMYDDVWRECKRRFL